MEEWTLYFPWKRNHSNWNKRLVHILSPTFRINKGACSLMMTGYSINICQQQVRNNNHFIVESDSVHHAAHQSVQDRVAVRCMFVRKEGKGLRALGGTFCDRMISRFAVFVAEDPNWTWNRLKAKNGRGGLAVGRWLLEGQGGGVVGGYSLWQLWLYTQGDQNPFDSITCLVCW